MVDNGKISTYVITLLGVGAGIYFLFQSVINGFMTEQGAGYLIPAITFFAGTAYNMAYPRMQPIVKELMTELMAQKGVKGGE